MYSVDSPRAEQRKDYLKLSEELSLKLKLPGEDLLSLILSDSLSAPPGVSDRRFDRGRVNAGHEATGAVRLGIRLHWPARMTCGVDEPTVFNDGLSPESMRGGSDRIRHPTGRQAHPTGFPDPDQ